MIVIGVFKTGAKQKIGEIVFVFGEIQPRLNKFMQKKEASGFVEPGKTHLAFPTVLGSSLSLSLSLSPILL